MSDAAELISFILAHTSDDFSILLDKSVQNTFVDFTREEMERRYKQEIRKRKVKNVIGNDDVNSKYKINDSSDDRINILSKNDISNDEINHYNSDIDNDRFIDNIKPDFDNDNYYTLYELKRTEGIHSK
jgi:hypothetical protein